MLLFWKQLIAINRYYSLTRCFNVAQTVSKFGPKYNIINEADI